MKFVILAFVCAALGFGQAQVTHNRVCPNHPIMQNFVPSAYVGQWFEIQRYATANQQAGDCTVSQYSLFSAMIFNVQYSMIANLGAPSAQHINIAGHSWVSFPDRVPLPAMMSLSFTGAPRNSNYWILATDYNNYSIVWFCDNIGNGQSTGKTQKSSNIKC